MNVLDIDEWRMTMQIKREVVQEAIDALEWLSGRRTMRDPNSATTLGVEVALLGRTRARRAQLMARFGVPFNVAYRILAMNVRRGT